MRVNPDGEKIKKWLLSCSKWYFVWCLRDMDILALKLPHWCPNPCKVMYIHPCPPNPHPTPPPKLSLPPLLECEVPFVLVSDTVLCAGAVQPRV